MDTQGLRAYLEELEQQMEKLRTGAVDLQNKLAAVTATARSKDGYVTVEVGPRGQVLRLDLDPRIYRTPNSTKLAEAIVDTIQRATKDATDQVAALCKPFMPEEDVRAHLDQNFEAVLTRMDDKLAEVQGGDRP